MLAALVLMTLAVPEAPGTWSMPLPSSIPTAWTTGSAQDPDFRSRRLEFEIRHSLALLPEYGVFDHLGFELLGKGAVRLVGQVRSGVLRGQAERAARQVEGVEQVVNEIEILPVSSSDDALRVALYRAIFWDTPLERYAYHSMNPIHIIVKRGRITLEGVVGSEMDKTLAGMKAREVPLTFGVENNLRVEKR
jgi:hyperosmotically inducible periplasmic protein